jgi:hypothetical protein
MEGREINASEWLLAFEPEAMIELEVTAVA